MSSGMELQNSDNNNCDCCEGIKKLTPVKIDNLPGQSRLAYRVGTYNKFKQSMFVRLASNKALSRLTTRDATNDLAIALLDSSAVILDVLTLYQEMNANEGFLRTATERRSILELASEIGYKLRPGAAASTFLAFSLEENSLQPKQTIIDIGTKVQSLPGDSEMPQIFETVEKIEARAEWNNLKPELTTKQKIGSGNNIIYFQGVNTQLKPGDGILIVIKDADGISSLTYTYFRTVSKVIVDTDRQTTRVELLGAIKDTDGDSTGADDNFKTLVYALRTKAGIFGSSAPSYDVMPDAVTKVYQPWDAPTKVLPANKRRPKKGEGGIAIPQDVYYDKVGKLIYLDNSYSNIVPTSESNESWIVLDSPDIAYTPLIFKVQETREETLVDFASSTKVTGLVLDINDPSVFLEAFTKLTMRNTSVYAQNEELMLAEVPKEPIKKENSILLSKEIPFLNVGQLVSVTGETVDDYDKATGLTLSEIVIIAEIGVDKGLTKLTFKDRLLNSYKRDTVILNANVARATHGQTKQLVLGGGDPSRYLQHFVLKEKPLTYISAPTASGVKSTLEIHVDDILWKESQSLYSLGARDRSYITCIDNELQTHIFFGDGIRGLRPSAGLDNIKAKYRVGIGKEGGMLKAGQLNILMDMPLGVRGVTNPNAPDGADPENIDRARQNAPLTVLTMDRIVSLTDYENFARAFRGIGKGHAIWIWDGEKRTIYLTIASEKGTTVEPASDMYINLVKYINNFKDPATRFKIGAPELKTFNINAGILISDGFEFEKVKLKVEETLKSKFSFEARQFGQHVALSEVVSVIQGVEGVDAVNIEYLYLSKEIQSRQKLIPSKSAYWDDIARKVVSAEMVTLNAVDGAGKEGVTISEMRKATI